MIYIYDLSEYKTIVDNNIFNYIKDIYYTYYNHLNCNKNLFYLVGTKLDIGRDNIEKYREEVKLLLERKVIDFAFEVSSKTGEGINVLLTKIKIDSIAKLNANPNKSHNENLKYLNSIYYAQNKSKKKHICH